jgi:hypothetical protein
MGNENELPQKTSSTPPVLPAFFTLVPLLSIKPSSLKDMQLGAINFGSKILNHAR